MSATGQCRYPRTAILGGSARAAIGLAVTAVPLIMGRPNVAVAWLLAGAALLFGVYGIRSVQTTLVIADDAQRAQIVAR